MPTPASLRALLTDAIDYAGLFPPAELDLETALRNYSDYVRCADSWMLGPFVLPLTKFEATAAELASFDVESRLRISALGSKAENIADFTSTVQTAADSIRKFNAAHGATESVDQWEMPLPAGVTAEVIGEIQEGLRDLQVGCFFESPVDDAEQTIAILADTRGNVGEGTTSVGFKLRTGGVIASAFPSSVQVARALVAAAQHRVPIKFTAGLHHPIRGFQTEAQLTMHGFLNVLGAGVLGLEHEWDVQQTAAMLEDELAESFTFDDAQFTWREWSISTENIVAHRALVTSLGSCSFDEPREDLRALGLL